MAPHLNPTHRLFDFIKANSQVELFIGPALDNERELLDDDPARVVRKRDEGVVYGKSFAKKSLLVPKILKMG